MCKMFVDYSSKTLDKHSLSGRMMDETRHKLPPSINEPVENLRIFDTVAIGRGKKVYTPSLHTDLRVLPMYGTYR